MISYCPVSIDYQLKKVITSEEAVIELIRWEQASLYSLLTFCVCQPTFKGQAHWAHLVVVVAVDNSVETTHSVFSPAHCEYPVDNAYLGCAAHYNHGSVAHCNNKLNRQGNSISRIFFTIHLGILSVLSKREEVG